MYSHQYDQHRAAKLQDGTEDMIRMRQPRQSSPHPDQLRDELLQMVKELKLLFQSALLCTTPEIAKDGMAYVKKAEALIAKAEGQS